MRGPALPVLLALLAPLLLAGCTGPAPGPPGPGPDGGQGPPPPPGPPPEVPAAAILDAARAFDGARALALVEAQVLGPCPAGARPAGERCPVHRIPGTPEHAGAARQILGWMAELGWTAALQPFEATFEGQAIAAHNVVAERRGATNRTLYLGAHFDTRPCADKDPDPARRGEPVLGANDGASGVAVAVELARLLQGRALNLTLRWVFFDAEDMGDAGLGCGEGTPWIQGSTHYAEGLSPQDVVDAHGMVLLDMVGDRNLTLRREARSAQEPHRALQDEVWAWAGLLGHKQFRDDLDGAITDDHLPFQQRGIRAVDLIHLDDGPDVFASTHHTTSDDLGHLSAASLEAVGETTLAAILAWDAAAGGALVK